MWFPTASVVVAGLTAFPVSGRVTGEPKGVPSTENCTDPVLAPVPGLTARTDAVKTSESPAWDGFFDEVTVVVVGPLFTTWVRVFPLGP